MTRPAGGLNTDFIGKAHTGDSEDFLVSPARGTSRIGGSNRFTGMAKITTSRQSSSFRKRARSAKVFAAAAFSLFLASCAQPTHIDRPALNREGGPEDAMILPPPGGPVVVSVVERRFANAIQQDVILSTSAATPGQNTLRIQLFGPIGSDGGETTLSDMQPTDISIAREMRQVLPGIRMGRSPLFAQNAYGPFGFATGQSASGDLCLYAWQRLANLRSDATFATRGSVQVRLRLCQTGATAEGLLAVMYGYTINASVGGLSWNPYGLVPPADPRLGVTGQPIHPLGVSGADAIQVSAPLAEPAAPRPRARPAQTTTTTVTTPSTMMVQQPVIIPPVPANAPIVPPPPSANPGAPRVIRGVTTTTTPQAAPAVPPPPPSASD